MKLKCGTDKLKHRIFFASKMAVPAVADTVILCDKASELRFLLLSLPISAPTKNAYEFLVITSTELHTKLIILTSLTSLS